MVDKFGINFPYQMTEPRKLLGCFTVRETLRFAQNSANFFGVWLKTIAIDNELEKVNFRHAEKIFFPIND